MAKAILQIVIQTLKEGNADKETIQGLKDVQSSIGTATAVLGAMATAYAVVDKVIGESIRTTVDYASQVRDMTLLTGQSAEEASRTIQVMDDYKVSVSTLTMATKTLSKEGLTLNIETLAKLSDKYVSLGSGAEKTAFLVKNFGKSGMEMAEAMSKGGDAIRSASEAVNGNLVMTQKGIDAAREYEAQVDNLGDSWHAFQVGIGTAVMPTLNILLDALNKHADAGFKWENLIAPVALFNSLGALKSAMDDHNKSADETINSTEGVGSAMKDAAASAEDLAAAEKAQADAAKEITKENTNLLSVIGSIQSEEQKNSDKVRSLADERIQIEKDKAAAVANGAELSSDEVRKFDAALKTNSEEAKKNADEHELASHRIILGILEQKLKADGNLSDDELNWLLEKGKSWGIYSQTVIDEARKAIDEANKINESINGIPSNKEIQIKIHAISDYLDQISDNRERDSGGPGTAGQAYIINPQAGPEAFIPSTNGYFVPNIDRLLGGGGNVSVTLTYAPGLSIHDQSDITDFVYAGIRKAKADGILK